MKAKCDALVSCPRKQHFLSSHDKWSEQWVLCAIQEKLKEHVISGGDLRVQKISLDLAKEVHLFKKTKNNNNKKVGQGGGGGWWCWLHWIDGNSGLDCLACPHPF